MNSVHFERRVREVVERVLAGGNAEDSLFELKSAWIEPLDAARRVAALSNAASGRPVGLIVGVNENEHRLVAPGPHEKSDWGQKFDACFDGRVVPYLRHDLDLDVAGGRVQALMFETDRAPYVVRARGESKGEVPFRVGTRVEYTRREDLLRILIPQASVPDLELVVGILTLNSNRNHDLSLDLYVMPRNGDRIGIAAHRTAIEVYDADSLTKFTPERLQSRTVHDLLFSHEGQSRARTLTFEGARMVKVTGTLGGDVRSSTGHLGVAFSTCPALTDVAAQLRVIMRNGSHATIFSVTSEDLR